jgi:hypothetical protein
MVSASSKIPIVVIVSYCVTKVYSWSLPSYKAIRTSPVVSNQKQPRYDRIRNDHIRVHRNSFLYALNLNDNDDETEWSDFDDLGYTTDDPSKNNSSNSKLPQKYVPQIDDVVDSKSATSDLSNVDFAKLLQEKQQQSQQQRMSSSEPISNIESSNINNNLYIDYTAIQTRQFSLGQDIVLSDYVGTMGFQEVTDWEYYYPEEDEDEDDRSNVLKKKTGEPSRRQVVQPNPFDASK